MSIIPTLIHTYYSYEIYHGLTNKPMEWTNQWEKRCVHCSSVSLKEYNCLEDGRCTAYRVCYFEGAPLPPSHRDFYRGPCLVCRSSNDGLEKEMREGGIKDLGDSSRLCLTHFRRQFL